MNNFKVLKSLKIDWLKNNSENGGAMELVINSKEQDNIIVHSQTRKKWQDVV